MWPAPIHGLRSFEWLLGNLDLNRIISNKSLSYFTDGKQAPKKTTSKPSKTNTSKVYTVKSGDTLSEIAQRYGTTVSKLVQINGIKNQNKIYVGQKIKVTGSAAKKPSAKYHTVKRGDTVSELAVKYDSTQKQIQKWNKLSNPNKIYVGQKLRVK